MNILENDIAGALTFIQRHLISLGITTVQHHNFKKFKKTMKKLRGTKCSGQFDVKKTLLHNGNAFWLEWRHNQKTIGIHAMRCDDYYDTDLASIWLAGQQTIVYGGGKIGDKQPELAKQMRGKIVYGGDLYMSAEFRGVEALSTSIALQSFLYAEIKWKPDWIYGFIDKKNVTQRGFAGRFGYNHKSPVGTHWKKPPKNIRTDDYLAALDRTGLARNAWVIATFGLGGLLHKQ